MNRDGERDALYGVLDSCLFLHIYRLSDVMDINVFARGEFEGEDLAVIVMEL